MKTYVISTILVLMLTPRITLAQGNLVVNGSFDTDASGWTTGVSLGYRLADWVSAGDPGGSIEVFWSTDQQINGLVPGFSYLVSWSCIGEIDTALAVDIDDIALFTVDGSTNTSWEDFSFVYKATSSRADLAFVNMTFVSTSYGVDNVSIEAVPEVSTGALTMLGILLLFLWWRVKWPNKIGAANSR